MKWILTSLNHSAGAHAICLAIPLCFHQSATFCVTISADTDTDTDTDADADADTGSDADTACVSVSGSCAEAAACVEERAA